MEKTAPRILIVDDEGPLRSNLSRAARRHGYDAHTASDGNEAWRVLETAAFDLVVTDLRMPGMGGPELLGRIAEGGIPTPVVVITGYASLGAAVDCLRKGAVDFLVKPFEVETFLDSLDKALAKRRPGGWARPDWEAVAKQYGLTRRQREVLEAFYETGLSNRALAERLCLSAHTVKSHLKAAFSKLGVATRAQVLQRLRNRT